LDTIKKQPLGRTIQIDDSISSSGIKKATTFGTQWNMSTPNAAESSNPPGLTKKQLAVSRGTPPPVPPNKPNIPPKKDIMSFIKKTSVVENASSNAN